MKRMMPAGRLTSLATTPNDRTAGLSLDSMLFSMSSEISEIGRPLFSSGANPETSNMKTMIARNVPR